MALLFLLLALTALILLPFTDADQYPISPASFRTPPLLGLGTWKLKVSPQNTSLAVSAAIQAGYRHIDCAAIYGNEREVGEGIKFGLAAAGLERGDIWVTSKLWNDQ